MDSLIRKRTAVALLLVTIGCCQAASMADGSLHGFIELAFS